MIWKRKILCPLFFNYSSLQSFYCHGIFWSHKRSSIRHTLIHKRDLRLVMPTPKITIKLLIDLMFLRIINIICTCISCSHWKFNANFHIFNSTSGRVYISWITITTIIRVRLSFPLCLKPWFIYYFYAIRKHC